MAGEGIRLFEGVKSDDRLRFHTRLESGPFDDEALDKRIARVRSFKHIMTVFRTKLHPLHCFIQL